MKPQPRRALVFLSLAALAAVMALVAIAAEQGVIKALVVVGATLLFAIAVTFAGLILEGIRMLGRYDDITQHQREVR